MALAGGNRRAVEYALRFSSRGIKGHRIDDLCFSCPDEECQPFLEWILSQGACLEETFMGTSFDVLLARACKNAPRPKFLQYLLTLPEFQPLMGSTSLILILILILIFTLVLIPIHPHLHPFPTRPHLCC